MIHVIHIFTHMRQDALSENFLDFLTSYDRKEMSVTVILPQESPLLRQVEEAGHSPILLKNIGDAPHFFVGRHALRKVVRKLSPDAVHLYNAWVLDALRTIGIPLIATLNQIDTSRYKKSPHTFIAFSPWAKDCFLGRGIAEQNIALLPMGIRPVEAISEEENIRLRRELGFDPDDIVVGVFHPFTKCKGYPLFLAAAALAKEVCPNLRFLVVGGGPMRHQYMRKAVSLGLKRFIRFLSDDHPMNPLLCVADIHMEISENVSLRRHTLAAMSLGKPIIAFDSGGNSYMVENGVTGLLIRQFSSKKIAGAMLEFANHPQIAAAMGAAGRKRMLRLFSAEVTAKETVDLYRRIVSPIPSSEKGGDESLEKTNQPKENQPAG